LIAKPQLAGLLLVLGRGPALNVTVDRVDVEIVGVHEEHDKQLAVMFPEAHINFDPVMFIEAASDTLVTHRSYVKNEQGEYVTSYFDWLRRLTPQMAHRDYDLKIRFMDVLGNRYVQTMHVGRSSSWPDVVESDMEKKKYGYPTIGLVMPFLHSP
jgi:hypothetical protein